MFTVCQTVVTIIASKTITYHTVHCSDYPILLSVFIIIFRSFLRLSTLVTSQHSNIETGQIELLFCRRMRL